MSEGSIHINSCAWTGLEPHWAEEYGLSRAGGWKWAWAEWMKSRRDELSALAALWAPPVYRRPRDRRKGWTVFDGYHANRDDDWTFLTAIRATTGILLRRYWGQRHEDRAKARFEQRKVNPRWNGHYWDAWSAYPDSHAMAFWNAHETYSGYDVMRLVLRPGCRIEIFSDGECLM